MGRTAAFFILSQETFDDLNKYLETNHLNRDYLVETIIKDFLDDARQERIKSFYCKKKEVLK